MYFDNFPKILYDFPLTETENKFLAVRDITTNIRFKTDFIKSISVYDTYKIKNGESIEDVAEKLYGSPDNHWILMVFNDRYDHIEDMPLDNNDFERAVNRKYGTRLNDVHHYEKDGIVTNGIAQMTLGDAQVGNFDTLYAQLKTHLVIRKKTVVGYYSAIIDQVIDKDTGHVSVFIGAGSFKAGDKVQVVRYYSDSDGEEQEQVLTISTIAKVDVNVQYEPVTNYEYEYFENEKKRIIKVVPKQYLEQILAEFEALI